MSSSPLEMLHLQFDKALKDHAYMGVSKTTNRLEKTTSKDIRLDEVFENAQDQIETDLKGAPPLNAGKTLTYLKLLEKDGEAFYARYQASTNTWMRVFLKGLAYYTPAKLKSYLPSCFSNRMADAEIDTKNNYDDFKQFLSAQISQLSIGSLPQSLPSLQNQSKRSDLKDHRDPKDDDHLNLIFDEDDSTQAAESKTDQTAKKTNEKTAPVDFFDLDVLDDALLTAPKTAATKPVTTPRKSAPAASNPILLPTVQPPTKEEIEAKNEKALKSALKKIEEIMNAFKEFDQIPLSMVKYKTLFMELMQGTKLVIGLDPANGKSALEKIGITAAELTTLSDIIFFDAFVTNNTQKIEDLLKPTQWNNSYSKVLAQKGHIHFGIKKLLGNSEPHLKNDQNNNVKEADFKAYQGKVKISLADVNLLTDPIELEKFLAAHPTCRPCTIEIQVKDKQTTTPELINILLKLSTYCREIHILGLEEIAFKGSAVSADDEHRFVQKLDCFVFPHLKSISLSDHPKKDWTASEFSALLALCPSLENFQAFVGLCSSPEEIIIPNELLNLSEIDFKGFTPAVIPHVLAQLTQVNHVNLSGCAVTDDQLALWIAQGFFANVHTLRLDKCSKLTTDVLHYLMKLPNLASLSLPDLPEGTHKLDRLPSFENPFKINLFYIASKVTREIAAERYTGPLTWAPVFQIPLARQKATTIFTKDMSTLDPKSVAYWLYKKDYLNLAPQTAVKNILADSNAGLTDDNLIEFMQKFPKAVSLSLYNCPNVTSKGISNLLKACPQLRTLDLTGCSHITEELFFEDGIIDILKKFRMIIITDTGITSEVACAMQENDELKGKLEYEETTLTITDNDLTDDQALDKLLKGKTLNKLRRINLEGCNKLTNQMLGQLLDHLNADIFIKNNEGAFIDNPQRLNLAVLNLVDCVNITGDAFDHHKSDDGKIEPKSLENLDRIIFGGTKIEEVLQEVYPQVTFQAAEEPVTISIDPARQLELCQLYYRTADEKSKEQLVLTLVPNRIVVELFGSECPDKAAVEAVRTQPIDTTDEDFCDITLMFRISDSADSSDYSAHRDVLYSRSRYFVNGFRPGGLLSRQSGLCYINEHATPEASQAIMDMLYGKLKVVDSLDWKTAADAAELAGPHIFSFPKHVHTPLLERFRSQFDVNRAEAMLMAAVKLNDKDALKEFEKALIDFLENKLGIIVAADNPQFRALANIAKNYNLKVLKQKTDHIEKSLTQQLQRQILTEQKQEDAMLFGRLFG